MALDARIWIFSSFSKSWNNCFHNNECMQIKALKIKPLLNDIIKSAIFLLSLENVWNMIKTLLQHEMEIGYQRRRTWHLKTRVKLLIAINPC